MSFNTENITSLVRAVGTDVKEIKTTLANKADKSDGSSSDGAIVSKMTELGQKFTDLENTDFVQIYTTAKNSL